MQPRPRRTRLPLPLLLVLAWAAPAAALVPGNVSPPFRLPWLTGEEAPASDEIFGGAPLTAVVFWNRGCSRCTEIALACDALADSLRPLGVPVTAILFGPDDPVALAYLLDDRGIRLRHLWDTGAVARDYGLGTTHLASFLVDSGGTVQAAFDDRMEGLVAALMPEARRVLTEMASGRGRPGGRSGTDRPAVGDTSPSTGIPQTAAATPDRRDPSTPARAVAAATALRETLELDVRTRYAATDGSRPEDRGLLGEPLQEGTSWIHRVDLKLRWSPVRGLEVVPWLRWSSEDQEAVTGGAEQLSSARGTVSVNVRRGAWHGTLGAFPLRLAPLLLQRWDAEDALLLGATACGCGGGVTGITARSLEVPGPLYTFEGIEAGGTARLVRLRAAGAVARREQVATAPFPLDPSSDPAAAEYPSPPRYRKVLAAAALDLGGAGAIDGRTGLSAPLGLRLSVLALNDDRRSIDLESHPRPEDERDERAVSAWASAGPWSGVALEAETAWWRLDRVRIDPVYGRLVNERIDARGFRAGTRVERTTGPWRARGRLCLLRTEPGFEPFYRALTYQANREGWRGALALAWNGPPGEAGRPRAAGTERVTLEMFHRTVRETEDNPALRENPGQGRERESVTSLSLTTRLHDDWPAELDLVRVRADHPAPLRADDERQGVSLQMRCSAVPAIEPALRFDWIRLEKGDTHHAVRTVSLWVRVTG